MPPLLPSDALLLLPRVPAGGSGTGRWAAALADWQVAPGTGLRAGSPDPGAEVLLLEGPDRGGRLAAAGYQVAEWDVRRLPSGTVVAAPRGDRELLRRTARHARVRLGRREALRGALARRRGVLTVAARSGTTPAALTAAGLGPRAALVLSTDGRRRAVFLVADAAGQVTAVVKAERRPGTGERGAAEQAVLRALQARLPTPLAPRPLGCGTAGPVPWSAESAVPGRPLAELLPVAGPARVRRVLTGAAGWLGELARATAAPVAWEELVGGLPLRGAAAELRAGLARLAGVPGVLAHGDLASGLNVLVDADDRAFVVDWETARPAGLPLLDLLPLLCTSLARAEGVVEPHAQAARVLQLVRGDGADGRWLLEQVRAYARALSLPPDLLGPLAALAWGYQASMRAVHDELLVAAGLPAPPWTSAAEVVLAGWLGPHGPGLSWDAVVAG